MAVSGYTSTFFECTVNMTFGHFSWEEFGLDVQPAGVATIHHSLQILFRNEDSIRNSADNEDYGMLHGDQDGLGD